MVLQEYGRDQWPNPLGRNATDHNSAEDGGAHAQI